MPQYRTLDSVAYIQDGVVVHAAKDRNIELTEEQAKALGKKVKDLTPAGALTFPKGSPVIDHLRLNPEPAVKK